MLADASGRYTPDGWARAAAGLYRSLNADRIVAESNFGGQMVEATIRAVDGNLPVRMVHASRGKVVRAEPIVALYEQRRVQPRRRAAWARGSALRLGPDRESGPSPDRLDALVWALTDLMGERQPAPARFTYINWMGR